MKVLKTGGDIPHFGVYLLLGIVLWNYFVEVTNGSIQAIVAKGDLMRKVNFPRYVIILAGSFSALINLCLNLLVVSLFMMLGKAEPSSSAVLLPLLIIELFVFSLALSFLLSAAYVRFRDLNFIWEVIIQIAFYATPILYAFSFIAEKSELAAKILIASPLAQIIQDARHILITDKSATIASVYSSKLAYLIPLSVVALTTIAAVVYFKKQAPSFAENV